MDQVGRKARTRGVALVAAGVILGFLGLVLGWPAIWPSALLPALAGLALIPTVLTGRQKSIPGELLVVTAFSSLALLLAAASGADPGRGLAATLVWWISFALGTLEVHAIKARVKAGARSQWTRWGSPLASIMVLTGALLMALGQWGSPRWAGPAAALLPPTLAILVLTLVKVHPRHLKRVGWTLVGANALTLLGLLQGG